MSFDFALQQICPHFVALEKSTVDLTRGVVFFNKQPANVQSITLYFNGEIVPPFGLYSYAELPIGVSEPYRVKAGVNDLLYIGIGNAIPRFVQVLTGPNLKAAEIAADLQRKLPQLQVSVENRRVVFRSRAPSNGSAFQFPDPRWTDRTSSSPFTARSLATFKTLGINPGRVVSGRKIIPGWSVVQDLDSPIATDRAIQFESTIPNSNPVIQLSYVTSAQQCRRCYGSRIEFDYNVLDGTYETVRDTDLLAQEFDKFLFTRLGSHWKWSWLGSRMTDHIGGKANATRSLAPALISLDINQAYQVYSNIKTQQEQRFPFQQVTDAEMPTVLDNVSVRSPKDDPTTAIVDITVRSRSRVSVPFARSIGNPNPTYLADGKNGGPFIPRGLCLEPLSSRVIRWQRLRKSIFSMDPARLNVLR